MVAGEADGTEAGAAAGGGATGEVAVAGEAGGTGAGVGAGGGGAKAGVGAEGEARGEVPPGGETAAGEVSELGLDISRGWYERVGEILYIFRENGRGSITGSCTWSIFPGLDIGSCLRFFGDC